MSDTVVMSDPRPARRVDPPTADAVGPSWAQGPLEWRQTHWRRSEWELITGAERIGSLAARGVIRERNTTRGPSGDWEFQEHSTGRTEITLLGSATPAARFRPHRWGGGAISTASGFRHDWVRVGFWKPEHAITNDYGFPCVRFLPHASAARVACVVAIEPAGLRIPEVEALVFLGWRLLVPRRAHAH